VRILLTGAAGNIGRALRPPLRERAALLRLADTKQIEADADREDARVADLADRDAVTPLMDGIDAVVHLAGIPTEDAFERLVDANLRATYNVYEAARLAGVRRVVYASSNHATGFYGRAERISLADRPRPDTLYGATKVFGEALGSLYADKFGLEVVALRIGGFAEEPPIGRPSLPMWVSPDDLFRLVWASLTASDVGFELVYGVSRTGSDWWENAEAARRLGYEALDEIDAGAYERAEWVYQGDPFTSRELHGESSG
jgi:uronate dehydrogenase